MDLIRELIGITDAKTEQVTVTEGREDDLGELIDKYIDQERLYSWESSRGVRNLQKLVKVLDPHYRDIDTFLEDNSGAIEAIVEWIKDRNVSEWASNVKNELRDEDEIDEALITESSSEGTIISLIKDGKIKLSGSVGEINPKLVKVDIDPSLITSETSAESYYIIYVGTTVYIAIQYKSNSWSVGYIDDKLKTLIYRPRPDLKSALVDIGFPYKNHYYDPTKSVKKNILSLLQK